jgi:hypothetical protein
VRLGAPGGSRDLRESPWRFDPVRSPFHSREAKLMSCVVACSGQDAVRVDLAMPRPVREKNTLNQRLKLFLLVEYCELLLI